jgi:hypothetical protein
VGDDDALPTCARGEGDEGGELGGSLRTMRCVLLVVRRLAMRAHGAALCPPRDAVDAVEEGDEGGALAPSAWPLGGDDVRACICRIHDSRSLECQPPSVGGLNASSSKPINLHCVWFMQIQNALIG